MTRKLILIIALAVCARIGAAEIESDQTMHGFLKVNGATHTIRQVAELPPRCTPAANSSPGEAVIRVRDASLHYCAKKDSWAQVGLSIGDERGGRLAPGRGIAFVGVGDEIAVEIDAALVPTLTTDHVWAGHNDFTLSTMRLPNDRAKPHPAGCTAPTVGRIWIDSSPGGALYACLQLSEANYKWVAYQGTPVQ